jgi:fructose-1,6-bisphosphatase I/sedoheptulose-1,7-bisphosphatase
MSTREKTITEFMIEEQRRFPEATGDFTACSTTSASPASASASSSAAARLAGAHGSAGEVNVQGETQMKLDVMANDIFLRTSEYGGNLAGMVSEELESPIKFRRVPIGNIC